MSGVEKGTVKGAVKGATPGCRTRTICRLILALLLGVCYSFPLLVVCPSGRRCITRNDVWCKSQRGFKSLHHRTNENPSRFVSAGFCMPGLFWGGVGGCVGGCLCGGTSPRFIGCVPLPGLCRCLLIRGWVKSYYAY